MALRFWLKGQFMAKQPDNEPTYHRGRFGTGRNHSWLYGVIGVLIIVLVLLVGMGIGNHHRRQDMMGGQTRGVNIIQGPGLERHGAADQNLGSTVNVNSGQTRVSGVVTAVNGSSFTLAGSGATVKVTTNGSTRYQDGNQVKQNDTVMVFGNETNGTITATRIRINP